MLVSVAWLQDYVDCQDVPSARLVERLTLTGTEVKQVREVGQGLAEVRVARVAGLRRMPGSDHLWLVDVDVDGGGAEPVPVVCGAQNLHPGALVPWAPPGAVLPDGLRLAVRRMRGHESRGMLCAPDELRLGDDHEGILLLDEGAAEVGAPLSAVFPPDRVLELEVTANRPDCLHHAGVARELAAALGRPLRPPDLRLPARAGTPAAERVTLEVADPGDCRRYRAELVTGIGRATTPAWMAQRLRAVGQRPLHPVVDIANYVMLDVGQPLHTFDWSKMGGGAAPVAVGVRRGRSDEELTGLDGVTRRLGPEVLVITAADRPVGLAGVQGGAGTAVDPDTAAILLEAACFAGTTVRASARRLGLRTEASARFERQLAPTLPEVGSARFLRLLDQITGAQLHPGPVEAYPGRRPPAPPVIIDGARLAGALGLPLSLERAAAALRSLEFTVTVADGRLAASPPPDRLDVAIPEDLVEEVGRVVGYDQVPATLPGRRQAVGALAPAPRGAGLALDVACAAGFDEAITYSFQAEAVGRRLPGAGRGQAPVPLRNALGPQWAWLRVSCLPGLLESCARNQARSLERTRLVEIGHAFWGPAGPDQPTEPLLAALVDHVPGGGAVEAAERLRRLLAVLALIGERVGLSPLEFQPVEGGEPGWHASRCVHLSAAGRWLGVAGEVDEGVAASFDLRGRVVAAELRCDGWLQDGGRVPRVHPVARTPAVVEDLSVVVGERAALGVALRAVRAGDLPQLESIRLLDEYTDARLGPAHKGWTFRLVLRDPTRTLTGAEAHAVRDRVVTILSLAAGARLREGG